MDVTQGRSTKAEYIDALVHLTAAIRELQEVSVEPLAFRATAT